MDFIEIEVVNWRKHQRKDVKKPSWFALDNRILEDAKLYGLTDAEWKALIYIFSQASQQGSENVRLNFAHARRVCDIPEKTLKTAISRLSDAGVTRTLRERYADVTPQDKTGQDTTEQDTTVTAVTPAGPDLNLSRLVWDAYSTAYFDRYGTEPVRNKKVNSQIKQLAERLGQEAPDIVRFYLTHSKSFYISNMHSIGICLSDAEALRTQWATGQKITQRQARQADDAAAVGDQLARIRNGQLGGAK